MASRFENSDNVVGVLVRFQIQDQRRKSENAQGGRGKGRAFEAMRCFFPEHFNEPPVKDLMPVDIDPITGVPSFKLASATIEKIDGADARRNL